MNLDSESLKTVAHDLLTVMLGFRVEFRSAPAGPAGATLTSEIRIVGERVWRLDVSCPFYTASVLAARIYRLPPAELDDDLLLDALGEVANILSGNLKGMLDGEYALTLPATRTGPPRAACAPADISLELECDELPLAISLCEESPELALAAEAPWGAPLAGAIVTPSV